MSAITSRGRRATAGKRMSSLVGKAQEDDDAFWGHDTWVEDDSGNDSFRESDEDSEARVDEFDSDFNESETDNEAEEAAAGAEAEAELQRQEKNQRRKQKFDVAKAGRDLMQKKKGKGKKRAMGDGINAGLVLNFPSAAGGAVPPPGAAAPVPLVPPTPKPKKAPKRRLSPRSPTGKKRSLRAGTVTKTQQAVAKRKATAAAASTTTTTTSAKKKQKRFTQEELLLEAATVTESENERWLLARQRVQQQEDALHKGTQEGKRGKVICKFRSRRGCLNSLTFPEMDHVPDILARKHVPPKQNKVPTECVITGKKALYRDPKTMLGYHDIAAFKELRRRFNTGEPLDQRKKTKKVDKDVVMLDSETANGGKVATTNGSTAHQANGGVATAAASSAVKTGGELSGQTNKTDVPSNLPAATPLKYPAPASLQITKPTAVESRSTSTGRSSPRKRKLSAKAVAAVETELLSPGKASISSVIRNMTMPPPPDVATNGSAATTAAAPVQPTPNGNAPDLRPTQAMNQSNGSDQREQSVNNALNIYNKTLADQNVDHECDI